MPLMNRTKNQLLYSVINDATDGISELGKALKDAKRPLVILGSSVFDREDGAQVHAAVRNLCNVRLYTSRWIYIYMSVSSL